MLAYDYTVIAYYYQRMFNLYPFHKIRGSCAKDTSPPRRSRPSCPPYIADLWFRFEMPN